MAIESTRRLFTVRDYYRMGDAGVFGPDERVELLEGEILRMNPIGPRHANCVGRLTQLFVTALGDRVDVRIQNPVASARSPRYSRTLLLSAATGTWT